MFRDRFGADVADERRHLDLRLVVERTLQKAGVERIEQVAGCTSCDSGAFFSYRRDQRNTGRQLSFVRSGSGTDFHSRAP
jgi:copper oxidase (laccase) domain-containing protein